MKGVWHKNPAQSKMQRDRCGDPESEQLKKLIFTGTSTDASSRRKIINKYSY